MNLLGRETNSKYMKLIYLRIKLSYQAAINQK